MTTQANPTSLNNNWFADAVAAKPSGKYAHIIVLRVTDSYSLFQTDGGLNTARVQTGEKNGKTMTRITMFKRKQTTAERLMGRELLRRHGFLSGDRVGSELKDNSDLSPVMDKDGLPICEYNEHFCKTCPDCITYGFAISNGSEKSKVLSDTAYSLTAFDDSHEVMTLNAPYEEGVLARRGSTKPEMTTQDHVRPQIIFPSVITVRDVTLPLFLYVLNNVARSKRYGAQTTRTGTMTNHIVGIALTDGEIFSNLRFTQVLYDTLEAGGKIKSPDPISIADALSAAQAIVPDLLKRDRVTVDQHLNGDALNAVLTALPNEDAAVKSLLKDAFANSRAYFDAYIKKDAGGAKRGRAKK